MGEFTISVGRCPQSNDILVADGSVSRQHLLMQIIDLQNIVLHDRQSAYGSYYWDGEHWQQFSQIQLTANDYVILGGTKLRIMEFIIAYQVKYRGGSI